MEHQHRPVSAVCIATWLMISTLAAGHSQADERPADALLRLVPPNVAVVLAVEDLRDHALAFSKSRLAADLRALPSVKAWFESEKYQQFAQSRAMIETVLGASLTELRDDIVGDAVVLALKLPTDPAKDNDKDKEPRGLVLVRARNPVLLQRVIRIINLTQRDSGELSQVVHHERAGTTYHVREFPAASARPPEWYVAYPDGTFALSNAESLIQAVIDRKSTSGGAHKPAGLGNLPRFQSVQKRLPERAIARLFFDPRVVERAIKAGPPAKPSDVRVKAMIERYLGAVEYAGAALVWSERNLVLRAVETLDASQLDPWIVRLSHDARPIDPALKRVPATALAVASGRFDAMSLRDAIALLFPDQDQTRLTNIETLLTGLSLGQDVKTRVLPSLGPGVFGYVDTPSSRGDGRHWPFPTVLVVSLGDRVRKPNESASTPVTSTITVADAVENALRTMLAVVSLDDKRAQGRSRIRTQVVAGATVTTLDPPIPFAYAVDRAGDRLVLGNSAEAVAQYLLEGSSDHSKGKATSRFDRFQALAFPEASTFFCVDLDALTSLADRHRDHIAQTIATRKQRPIADVKGDLDQVLNLAHLFHAAYISSRIDADATAVHQSVGLIPHEPSGK